jgi:hypothetical protein
MPACAGMTSFVGNPPRNARRLCYNRLMLRRFAVLLAFLSATPLHAQALPEGQGEPEYRAWVTAWPGTRASILSFESWQEAAGVRGVLPTWQVVRTASMWRSCGGAPFEVPPPHFWPDMTRTLAFIRDHVRAAVGEVQAVSGYRNPALNGCAGGTGRSAHLDFFALDLVPVQPLPRRELFRRLCAMHAAHGTAANVGLGFYAFQRFHIDTRGFRRWGAAGPRGNESPCAVLERGEDPEAPPYGAAPPIMTSPPPAQ